MLRIYVFFAAAYAVTYLVGYPLKVLLLRDEMKRYDLYITPWLGMGIIMIALFSLSHLGFSVKSATPYLTACVLFLAAASWFKFRETPDFERRDVIFLVSTALLTGLMYGIPLVARDDWYAPIMNADYQSYLHDAKIVLFYSSKLMNLAPAGIPYLGTVILTLSRELRGCVFVFAFFSALFGEDISHFAYPLIVFVMFLSVASFRLFFRNFRNGLLSAIIVGIVALNFFVARLVAYAFIGQLFSFGFVTVVFFVEYYIAGREKFDPVPCLLLVFLITSCNIAYINAMPYPLLPAIALLLSMMFGKKIRRAPRLKNLFFAGGMFCAVNFPLIKRFVTTTLLRVEYETGFPMYFPTFMDAAGLQGAVPPGLFLGLLITANAAMAAALIYQMKKEGFASFLSVSFLSYLASHLAICAVFFSLGEKSSYNSYKSALFISFIVYIMLIRFIEERFDGLAAVKWRNALRREKLRVFAAPAVFAVCLPLVMLASSRNWSSYLNLADDCAMTKSYEAVKYFASSPYYGETDFIVNIDDPFAQYSSVYYAPGGRTYSCAYAGRPSGEARMMKDSFSAGDIYLASPNLEKSIATTNTDAVFRNGYVSIHELGAGSLIQHDYDGMSHEMTTVTTRGEEGVVRMLETNSVFLDYLASEATIADMSFSFCNFGEIPSATKVYFEGEP
ncbi:MAG: hypothetical protein LBG12_14130, partial [Synergistaceae bacterium]|nr:hypothetical protein [Synergistaceae bacterium]